MACGLIDDDDLTLLPGPIQLKSCHPEYSSPTTQFKGMQKE